MSAAIPTVKVSTALMLGIASVALTAYVTYETSKPDEWQQRFDRESHRRDIERCEAEQSRMREEASGLVVCLTRAATVREAQDCVGQNMRWMSIGRGRDLYLEDPGSRRRQ